MASTVSPISSGCSSPISRSTFFGGNNDPLGALAILDAGTNTADNTPTEGQRLRASIAGVTDADNPGDGAITGPVAYHWQVEARPGSGIFEDIGPKCAATNPREPRARPSL